MYKGAKGACNSEEIQANISITQESTMDRTHYPHQYEESTNLQSSVHHAAVTSSIASSQVPPADEILETLWCYHCRSVFLRGKPSIATTRTRTADEISAVCANNSYGLLDANICSLGIWGNIIEIVQSFTRRQLATTLQWGSPYDPSTLQTYISISLVRPHT